MKKKFLATVVAIGAVLSGCSGSKEATKVNPGKDMTGVAAVGAPIANGVVEVKGANGTTVSTTTNSNGVYSVALGSLASPYLVRVTSPTGRDILQLLVKKM